jgi:hypothetical protein
MVFIFGFHPFMTAAEPRGMKPSIQIKLAGVFDESLNCVENQNWKQAAEGFRETLAIKAGDGPAQKYLDRCLAFLAKPPPKTWDGVYTLTEK